VTPTPQELDKHVTPISFGGFIFKIHCRYCYDAGTISTNSQKWTSEDEKLKAAEKFVASGWKLINGLPVCPKCTDRKHMKPHDST